MRWMSEIAEWKQQGIPMARAKVLFHSRKPDATHRCHFVQEGLLKQGDGSPDHVSLLLPVGGGRKLRQLLAHIQDGMLSVRPRLGIRTSHLKIGEEKEEKYLTEKSRYFSNLDISEKKWTNIRNHKYVRFKSVF